eukprot:403372413
MKAVKDIYQGVFDTPIIHFNSLQNQYYIKQQFINKDQTKEVLFSILEKIPTRIIKSFLEEGEQKDDQSQGMDIDEQNQKQFLTIEQFVNEMNAKVNPVENDLLDEEVQNIQQQIQDSINQLENMSFEPQQNNEENDQLIEQDQSLYELQQSMEERFSIITQDQKLLIEQQHSQLNLIKLNQELIVRLGSSIQGNIKMNE